MKIDNKKMFTGSYFHLQTLATLYLFKYQNVKLFSVLQ